MKHLLVAAALTLAAVVVPAFASDVGISVSIGEPGFYGRIDVGDYSRPRLLYRQPRLIYGSAAREPIYLHVPPGHARNWRKHCRQYDACGERVYFVQDNWYRNVYVPQYQERHRNRHDKRGNDHRGNQNDRHGHDRDQGRDRY